MLRLRSLAVLISSCLFSTILAAQAPGTGLYAFGSFDNRGFDSINIGNLNQHFEIPIVNKQGRGLNFNYVIAYDGLIWNNTSSSGSSSWTPAANWGFNGQLNGALTGYMTNNYVLHLCSKLNGGGMYSVYSNFVFHDSLGGTHLFNYTYGGTSCSPPGNGNSPQGDGSTSDGSGLSYQLGTVYTRDGSVINAPPASGIGGGNYPFTSSTLSITDSNGNTITNKGNGVFTDTLGSTALTIGGSGTAASPLTFTYPVAEQADGSTTAAATMSYTTYTVQTNFGCSGIGEYGPQSVDLPSQITLADGSSYQFTYESTPGVSGAVTGRLASITLPTGGTISYQYTNGCGGGLNADGTTGSLSRTTSDGTRSYNRSPSTNGSTTTVQDESGNQSLYTFTDVSGMFYETHRQIYQGSISGTPLLDRQTCYNDGLVTPCDGVAITLPIFEVEAKSSWNGGLQKGVFSTYDSSSGLLLNSDVSDFGGTPLQNTTYSYTTPGRVSSVVVTDQNSNTVSKTTYGYDEQTPTTTSNIPQHSAVSGPWGNQTSSHLWINTSNTTLDTTTAYYDTGVPISSTGPTGTTQYTFDSATQGFATQVTPPTPSSGVSLPSYAAYDVNSGVQLSASDANNGPNTPQVQYAQYDKLLRPIQISMVDGGGKTYSYNLPPNAYGGGLYVREFTSLGGGNPNANTDVLYDAYGRVSRVGIYNGLTTASNDWYQVDYCYDAVGNLHFVSAQYQSSGMNASKQCSGTGTTYTYDALGRVTNINTPDGNTTYQYNSRAVESTDVNGVQKIIQKDALGRITSVCELSPNGLQGDSPQACGQDIAGTGYFSTYAYSLSNHTTTITQGAQTRSFQTDSLGRTVSVTEPESGTTTYTYAYNSTGLVVTRTRPQANQGNASTTTTTTTQYDSVGRPVSISYSDGTPTKSFSYDQADAWGGNVSLGGSKGHLTQHTVNVAGNFAGASYGYDSMGRVNWVDECQPSGCGNTNYDKFFNYSYDLAGNLVSENAVTNASHLNQTTSYTYSPAAEVTSITSSMTGPTYPSSLVSNIQNGPFGPLGYTLGNGLYSTITYDSIGRLNGQWICSGLPSGQGQAYCTGGSAQVYGYDLGDSGSRTTWSCDTVQNQCVSYGYDEFNRLAALSGPQNFSYIYDRYGNRWQQNAPQGGPAPQYSFNKANNQIIGFSYDAAGNLTNDGAHSYTYDAEGNLTQVDGGSTATYYYNALNQRVRADVSGTSREYVFNLAGKRVSIWDGNTHAQVQGQYYWGSIPVAFYDSNSLHFQHQDWLGTERIRTSYSGSTEGTFSSLPFGDAYSVTGSDNDAYHFAQLDHDSESNTEHAQFRNYSSTQGRWMSPDPYSGSYDTTNPQSFNRYSYVLNNPLSLVDPFGLDCQGDNGVSYGIDSPASYETDGETGCEGSGPTSPIQAGCPNGQVPDQNGHCYVVNGPGSITDQNGQSISVSPDGGTGVVTLYPLPSGGSSGGSGGNGIAPSSGFSLSHIAACSIGAVSTVLGLSEATNRTVGIGIGGSIGAGIGFGGGYLSFGAQIVGDPQGNFGVVTSFGFSKTVLGAGAQFGGQLSISSSSPFSGPQGSSTVYSGSYGIVGADVNAGGVSVTVGPAPGLKASASKSTQIAHVVSATNCSDMFGH